MDEFMRAAIEEAGAILAQSEDGAIVPSAVRGLSPTYLSALEGSATFSRQVRWSRRWKAWKTNPSRLRRRCAREASLSRARSRPRPRRR
mgnify:CR=1 FL=1